MNWTPIEKTLRYEVRQILDPATDPDCKRAWRNAHGSIDQEPRSGCGQVPIFVLKSNPTTEVESGQWAQRWAGLLWAWVVDDERIKTEFPKLAEGATNEPA